MAAQNQALECNVVRNIHVSRIVAKFLVHDWGDKVDSGMGCCTGPHRLAATAISLTTTLCRSQLYVPIHAGTTNLAIDCGIHDFFTRTLGRWLSIVQNNIYVVFAEMDLGGNMRC